MAGVVCFSLRMKLVFSTTTADKKSDHYEHHSTSSHSHEEDIHCLKAKRRPHRQRERERESHQHIILDQQYEQVLLQGYFSLALRPNRLGLGGIRSFQKSPLFFLHTTRRTAAAANSSTLFLSKNYSKPQLKYIRGLERYCAVVQGITPSCAVANCPGVRVRTACVPTDYAIDTSNNKQQQ